ncbi:MAG: EamA family transporter [Propionibacteriales bacterium]|nr:EamA family transporter [Propionibacteriales bacterium]
MSTRTRSLRVWVLFGALALLWGTNFLWIKVALTAFTPVGLTLCRLALGAVTLLPIALARSGGLPRERGLWLHLAVAALLGNAAPYLLFALGERHASSGLAGVMNATTPMWTVLLALALRTQRTLPATQTLGLALGFAGCLAIFEPWSSVPGENSPLGLGLYLAAAISYAVTYVYIGFIASTGLSPFALSAAQLLASTGWLALAAPFISLQHRRVTVIAVVALLVLGMLGTGIAHAVNYALIHAAGTTPASTVTYLIPVVSVLAGTSILHERVTLVLVVGVVAVLAGTALARRGAIRARVSR